VRRLIKAFDSPYRSVDLDAADYRENDRGGKIRNVLSHRTGSVTIPQIFVGNRHIGGCTETFDAFNDGRLQQLLVENGVRAKSRGNADAYSFLPKWLQPR
jgi:cysteine synthase A